MSIAGGGAVPDAGGHFGEYGGRYAPETLVPALDELAREFGAAMADQGFLAKLAAYQRDYVGRPTPLYHAERLGKALGGMRLFLKREDLCHTGAHKINNALGQALLAKRMGKKRIIAETGAGQHGVATATACALLDMQCEVYMGYEDIHRQALNVHRMRLLGATVVPVHSGTRTLKDATNEAMRDWVLNVRGTHYIVGSVVGPHPFPLIVRSFQKIIGEEARQQILAATGSLPDVVVACVGGGSNAMGIFHAFVPDSKVALLGAEAAGRGIPTGEHCATLVAGQPGVLHGSRSYLLQDEDGQVAPSHSISAGLDYPGVGPEHSYLKDSGRATYVAITDDEALEAFQLICRTEGIIPALESSHALAAVKALAPTLAPGATVLVNLSGRGDKDMDTVRAALHLPDLG